MRQISLRQIFSSLESYQLLGNILLYLLMCWVDLCFYLTMAESQSCCSVPSISPAPFYPFNSLSLVFTAELIFGECFTHQTKLYCGKQWIERKEGASKAWFQFIGGGSETEELLCAGSKQSPAHAPGIIFTILNLFFVFLADGALFDSGGVSWWFDYCWTVKDLSQFDKDSNCKED